MEKGRANVETDIEKSFRKKVERDPKIHNAYLRVHSEKNGIDIDLAAGQEGNAGSTGSVMFYHPASDAYIIGTMNHFGYGQKGVRFMLQIADKLLKATKKLSS